MYPLQAREVAGSLWLGSLAWQRQGSVISSDRLMEHSRVRQSDSNNANRRAAIDTRCVWSETGLNLEFKETEIKGLSTLSFLAENDFAKEHRVKGTTYSVETVSLARRDRDHRGEVVQRDQLCNQRQQLLR